MKALKIPLVLWLIFSITTACNTPKEKKVADSVTVSILPLRYFVDRISNSGFEVNVLVPPGASPETWEPSPGDMVNLSNSAVFFHTGYLEFEPVLAEKLAGKGPAIVDLSAGVQLIKGNEEEHGDHVHMGGVDPHYWVSVPEAKIIAGHIYKSLINLAPAKKEAFTENYNALIHDIDSLDQYIHKKLDKKTMRSFLIYHPAFTYYARDYKLEQIALEHEGKQPSTVYLRTLIDLARENDIKQVFVQQQFDKQVTESVARELGASLTPVDHLSADWLKNMYHMTDLIEKALHE
jgi:zinc transport system substrate-binding protein